MTGKKIDNIVILVATETGETQVFQDNPLRYVKALLNCIRNYQEEILVNNEI